MAALIAACEIRTCLGDGDATFAGLMRGECGARPLRYLDPAQLNVHSGYEIAAEHEPSMDWFRASGWLTACVRKAVERSGVDPALQRVVAIVGTGLRELRAVERSATEAATFPIDRLHFGGAVRAACPHVHQVVTLSNACSAGGHALALGQDLLVQGEADAVIVAAADSMTASMVAMIGRFAEHTARRVQPFDVDRTGVLLGDGAAAVVLVPDQRGRPGLARLIATGLSCDAVHHTVPDVSGVLRAVDDAFSRAGVGRGEVDLIVAHGTGTALNDPMELAMLRKTFADCGASPLITAVKGAVGHNSGAAALVSLDVALRCLEAQSVPPVTGLERVLQGAEGLPFVIGAPVVRQLRLAQINAFGFGGVNAISLVEMRA